MVPQVARLSIYPIKSLDGQECSRVWILRSGALQGDRSWAIFDQQGNFVNGKRHAQIHSLRSQFESSSQTLKLRNGGDGTPTQFSLEQDLESANAWLGNYFGFPVNLKQNLTLGFPDDTVSPGATIISTATLEEVASWYPELEVGEIRQRFRANIEIEGVPAFWEDRLFGEADTTVKFKIGEVEFLGVNPCQRCVVVTRNPHTGEVYPQFQKIFIQQRQQTLPSNVERSRFNHFFRLAVNTKLSPLEAGKEIKVGDTVSL